jgi:hypothetical protein
MVIAIGSIEAERGQTHSLATLDGVTTEKDPISCEDDRPAMIEGSTFTIREAP